MFKCEKGQVSAELLVIMAALIAVAIILVTQLSDTAKQSADAVNKKSKSVLEKIDEIEPAS